jgi:LPXTG-motif cell wall-anchored protein
METSKRADGIATAELPDVLNCTMFSTGQTPGRRCPTLGAPADAPRAYGSDHMDTNTLLIIVLLVLLLGGGGFYYGRRRV